MTPEQALSTLNGHLQTVVGAEIVSAAPYQNYRDTLELLLRIPKDRTQWHHFIFRVLEGLEQRPLQTFQLQLGTKYLLKEGRIAQGGCWILSGAPIPEMLVELLLRAQAVGKVRVAPPSKVPLIQKVDFPLGKRGGAFSSSDNINPIEMIVGAGNQRGS